MDSTQRSMFVDFDEYNIRRHWIQVLLNSCGDAWTGSPKDSHSSGADTTACGFDIMLCGAMHLSAAIPLTTLILVSLFDTCPGEHSMLNTSTFNNVHWWWTDPAHIGVSTASWRTGSLIVNWSCAHWSVNCGLTNRWCYATILRSCQVSFEQLENCVSFFNPTDPCWNPRVPIGVNLIF